MKKKTATYALAFLSLLSPNLSTASEETHKQKAQELLSMINPEEVFVSSFITVFDPMLENLKSSGASEAKANQIRDAAVRLAYQVARDPELSDQMTELYMDEFNEEELKEIIVFYKTPTGKKTLEKLPELMQKGGLIGQEITQKYQKRFQEEVIQIMQSDL